VQVDTFADLNISLQATAQRAAGSFFRVITLSTVFLAFILLFWAAHKLKPETR
jgi:hypothetical protein